MSSQHTQVLLRLRRSRWHVALTAIVALTYVAVALPLIDAFGPGVGALITVPVIAAGWCCGMWRGMIAGVIAILVNTLILNLSGEPGWDVIIRLGGGPGTGMLIPIGTVVGWLSDTLSKLDEGRQLTRQLVEQASDAVFFHDVKGRIFRVNERACQSLGYERHELLQLHIRDIAANATDLAMLPVWREMSEGQPQTFQTRQRRKDGTTFPVEVGLAALQFNGQPVFIAVTRDLTEREKLEEMRTRYIDRELAAMERERRKIGRELHDEAGQWIASLIAGLTTLEMTTTDGGASKRARQLRTISETALKELSRLSRGIHASVLDSFGLAVAVRRCTEDFSDAHNIRVDFSARGLEPDERLPMGVEIALYRITQEALTNVAKHAGATSVSVVIDRRTDSVRLLIEDDGCGFDPVKVRHSSDGLGLIGVRERATHLGGAFNIETSGGGTTIAVDIPVATQSDVWSTHNNAPTT